MDWRSRAILKVGKVGKVGFYISGLENALLTSYNLIHFFVNTQLHSNVSLLETNSLQAVRSLNKPLALIQKIRSNRGNGVEKKGDL